MYRHTTYHRTRPEAEAARAHFLESHPACPYQSSAMIEEDVDLQAQDAAEPSRRGFALHTAHFGAD